MDWLGIGLAVLGVSAPITAAVIRMAPRTNGYVSKAVCEERHVAFKAQIDGLKQDILIIRDFMEKRFDRLEDRLAAQEVGE